MLLFSESESAYCHKNLLHFQYDAFPADNDLRVEADGYWVGIGVGNGTLTNGRCSAGLCGRWQTGGNRIRLYGYNPALASPRMEGV
jgi:hypothetical protein